TKLHFFPTRRSYELIVLSWFDDFSELVPKENVIPEGMDDKSYRKYQLQLMDTSQHSSVVVGYEAAGAEVDFENNGIIVINVVEEDRKSTRLNSSHVS